MMAVKITYKPNHHEFGMLMISRQTRQLATHAAENGAVYAKAYARGAGLPADYISSIRGELGPIQTIGTPPNPRYTGRLIAEHPLGGVFEFGSGPRTTGGHAKGRRPQGGYSDPYRILGRAGARVGSPPRKMR